MRCKVWLKPPVIYSIQSVNKEESHPVTLQLLLVLCSVSLTVWICRNFFTFSKTVDFSCTYMSLSMFSEKKRNNLFYFILSSKYIFQCVNSKVGSGVISKSFTLLYGFNFEAVFWFWNFNSGKFKNNLFIALAISRVLRKASIYNRFE